MLATLLFKMLMAILALSTPTTARAMFPPQHYPNQKPLQQQPLEGDITMTKTLHTTLTSYIATSTITAILTRYTEDRTTAVPEAVQTWYAGQREEGCDRTACASCRVWYRCAGLEMEW